MVQLFF